MSRYSAAERAAVDSRRVERVYSALSRVYDRGFDWALGPGRRQAVSRMAIAPGQRVLEVGVGTGLSLLEYPEQARITGIDISEPMLDQARQRAADLGRNRVELQQMDARDLAFDDDTFDCVLAPYVISVVPEPERVMREIRRVCRPGGKVVIVNHFLSEARVLSLLERVSTPLSQWIGFKLDLPLSTVTEAAGFEIVSIDRVNLLGLWRLIEMRPT
ncbi:MAG: methyltransferase domain-containing protein [bacterium]|nr:methyltransferase domain-containing protein [bacterium]